VAPNYHSAILYWTQVEGATSYRVRWRHVGASVWKSRITTGGATSISGLLAGTGYAFRVSAMRDSLYGPESTDSFATPNGTVNPAVPRPVLHAVSGHRIRARWHAAIDATRYQVQIRRGARAWQTLGWRQGTYITSKALPAGRYQVRVRAWDSYLAGAYSAVARIRIR